MESLDQTYERYRLKVEEGLECLLPQATETPQAIHEAMRYCLSAGGKRIRPVLVLAAADLFPQKADPLPAAIAIECLHTYSLIHDDLPSMDDSPLRRGRASAHIQFDEATAVLAGDALLTEAFRLLAFHYETQPTVCVALVKCLSEAADSRHLIGGQVVDTLSENKEISEETLDYIHQHKTADLLTAALHMGLHLTEAPEEAFVQLARAGRAIGLAFQIIDDILDATSTPEELGKTVGSDVANAKNTYVSLHGMEKSREAAKAATSDAIKACLSIPSADTRFLQALIHKLEFRLN